MIDDPPLASLIISSIIFTPQPMPVGPRHQQCPNTTTTVLTHPTRAPPSQNPPLLCLSLQQTMEEQQPHSRRRRFDPIATLFHHYPINRISLFITTTSRRIMRGDDDNDDDTVTTIQSDYDPFPKPVIVVDVVWNLAFVLVSIVLLLSTLKERPSTPLRVWILGYAVQCLLHVGFVFLERRRQNPSAGEENLLYSSPETPGSRVAKRLESMNTMASFFWWLIGFYWIVVGGQALLQDAPRLYWLAVIFLAFDVFFAIFCVVLACLIGLALCCCLPCIIAMLYAMVAREGASEDDISVLPRFKFRESDQVAMMGLSGNEISLPPEDSECCICLSKYVDGVELHSLPCKHHFHCGCISKWLRINANCPLCKHNLLSGDELV